MKSVGNNQRTNQTISTPIRGCSSLRCTNKVDGVPLARLVHLSQGVQQSLLHQQSKRCNSCSVGTLLALASGKAERRQVYPLEGTQNPFLKVLYAMDARLFLLQLRDGITHALCRGVHQRALVGILRAHVHVGVHILHAAFRRHTRREVERKRPWRRQYA